MELRWKLAEIMVRYRIKSKTLSEALNMSLTAVSNLRNATVLPKLGGERICQIAEVISELSGKKITPYDLMECVESEPDLTNYEELVS